MTAKLIIIRGLPGSGKSTLAVKMINEKKAHIYYEADMYFIDPLTGEYKFEGNKIGEAHEWCQDRVKAHLFKGEVVIVSNTFTRHREMSPYVEFAKANNIPFEVIVCRENYGSIHGVPPEVLEKMKERWEE